MEQACNPNTWESDTERSQVQDQPDYTVRPYLKN